MGAGGERRSQAERRREMTSRVLDAAVDSLAEMGYARTTTVEVGRRAGVSRGAQLHYFPSRTDLLVAAVGHVMERRLEEFRKAMADAEPGSDRLGAAIDLLWSMWSGPTFAAWLELKVGGRTDPTLAAALADVERDWFARSVEVFTELFPPDLEVPGLAADAALSFTFALLDGNALQALAPGDTRARSDLIIEMLKAVARMVLPPEQE